MTRRAFVCECGERGCRRRLMLSDKEYEVLSSFGRVVSEEHDRPRVVARVRDVVAVEITNNGVANLNLPGRGVRGRGLRAW